MASINYDGVVEAVHFGEDGQVAWVRAYERRGPTFTDRIILDRQALVKRLKAGKRFLIGERVLTMGNSFKTSLPIRLVQKDGKDALVSGEKQASTDTLNNVPLL